MRGGELQSECQGSHSSAASSDIAHFHVQTRLWPASERRWCLLRRSITVGVQVWTHHAASSLTTGEDGGGLSRSQREWWRAASKVRLTAQCVA
jgi:hypothetical protein